MNCSKAAMGIGITLMGLVLSILGMVSYTELYSLGLPVGVMYVGYLVTIIGIILMYMDMKGIVFDEGCNTDDSPSDGASDKSPLNSSRKVR